LICTTKHHGIAQENKLCHNAERKLQKEFVNSIPPLLDKKLKKDKQTYYPIESQLCLLDVCSYSDYKKPPSIDSSSKANQFVDTYMVKKNKFLEDHGKMRTLSIFNFPLKNICSYNFIYNIFLSITLHLIASFFVDHAKLLLDTFNIPCFDIEDHLIQYMVIGMLCKAIPRTFVPYQMARFIVKFDIKDVLI
jgi:hypothetical protein